MSTVIIPHFTAKETKAGEVESHAGVSLEPRLWPQAGWLESGLHPLPFCTTPKPSTHSHLPWDKFL